MVDINSNGMYYDAVGIAVSGNSTVYPVKLSFAELPFT
jgi:hypothetical protein